MIQRIFLFIITVILEALAIVIFWLLATTLPILYSIIVIITVIAFIVWWILSRKKEKQKIYEPDELAKQRRKTIHILIITTASVILFTYIVFLIKVTLG